VPKIILSDATPVAKGSIRDVYRHPTDPSLLIKVVRLSTRDEKFGSGRRWYKAKRRRYGHFISYLREIREQIAVQVASDHHPDHLQKIVGFAETDLGLGLVVEAIFAPDGSYAPTLRSLLERGPLPPDLQASFERFCEAAIASPAIIADLHAKNVVYGAHNGEAPRFILIDGIGHKTLIPLEVLSPTIARWNNRHKVAKLKARVAQANLKAG
jgi:hypothetical protein